MREVLSRHGGRVLLAIGAVIMSTSSNYLILYKPTYAIKALGLPPTTGFIATLLGAIILGIGSPIAGHASDRAGRLGLMLGTTILFLVTAYPLFWLVAHHPSLGMVILVVAWMSLLKAGYSGVMPALMAELFPTGTRAVGMSLSYSIGVTIFGGFAPLVATWLIAVTGSNLAPSFYLMFTALLTAAALIATRLRLGLR